MSRTPGVYLSMTSLLIMSVACSLPEALVPDARSVSTAAAQTVIAGLTQDAPLEVFPPTAEMTSTPASTFTVQPPTLTPISSPAGTETQTPIPIFTPTSTIPLISVSVPTNCRNGPGRAYVITGSLLVGKIAEVYGRDPTGNYWYIRNPGAGAQFCWVWGEYATLTGSTQLLPVFTPPPTPTPTMMPTPSPSFTAKFDNLDSCAGWWFDLQLKNTGAISFRSVKIEVKDLATDVELVALTDGFTDLDGCLKTTTKDVLAPGDTFNLSAPAFVYNPSGNNIRVFITLCTNTAQKGGCVTNKINFKP
ncbi:MAG: hypothetical protein QY332_03745 [Anaerolineales bacterium]|nr:MAG: hypothetical protein QY332_03745 [Anaerolineales bacterium]